MPLTKDEIRSLLSDVENERVKRTLSTDNTKKMSEAICAFANDIRNLYKKVKDLNLVGSLSGHAEGSRAFARYRNIDEDIKKELVSLLD